MQVVGAQASFGCYGKRSAPISPALCLIGVWPLCQLRAQIERFSTVGAVPNRLCRTSGSTSPTSRTGHQTTAEQGASRPCICETATEFSPQPLICRNRNCLSKTRSCYSYCGSTESRRRLDRGTADGRTSSGCHSAMVRTHSRAHAMLPRPGNRRRNSTTAESSPHCSNAVRMTAACASLTQNIG